MKFNVFQLSACPPPPGRSMSSSVMGSPMGCDECAAARCVAPCMDNISLAKLMCSELKLLLEMQGSPQLKEGLVSIPKN